MSNATLHDLEKNFIERVKNPSLFREYWNNITIAYPPTHCLLDFKELPSTSIALHSGDLGFALLWIVQSVLVRCIIFDINQRDKWDVPIVPSTIGAMAHTEPESTKMIVRYSDDATLLLSGHKRYISGGTEADILLVTARRPGEQNFTKIVYIPANTLPENSLQDINLSVLPTIKHASLTITDFPCNSIQLSPVKDKDLRKILKKWSLIERSLIGEAYIAFLCYLAKHLPLPNQKEILTESENLLSLQQSFTRQQLENAFSNKYVDLLGDMAKVLNLTQQIANFAMEYNGKLDESLILRINDLNVFNKMRL